MHSITENQTDRLERILRAFERLVERLERTEDEFDRQRRPYGDGYRRSQQWRPGT
jgi:hypothetical protein